MNDPHQLLAVTAHSIHALLRGPAHRSAHSGAAHSGAAHSGAAHSGERAIASDRDRGAVSIEQVLWYAAAAVSVAVVATIIWSQIKSTAGTGVNTPSAP